ncbi:MAG: A/G-specific adenine glycosylase [Thermoanaerobaculia bacterium]|nr:A/G-specific adenine glycosylase [Thermoanaerobaculia bacterium]
MTSQEETFGNEGEREPRSGDPEALLDWYAEVARDLPWRESGKAYRVVVSEFMLQQTRVETVRPRYREFLQQFPTEKALAEAEEEEVLAAWSGLGYYRRARHLWRAVRIVEERGGWPESAEGLRELPGFGEYTAAAVASIVFGEAVAVLDGNVERVLSRWVGAEGNPKRAAVRRRLRRAAQSWIDPDRPGDSNQALMELGATVCRPRNPGCPVCPLRKECRARREGRPEDYPRKEGKRPTVSIALQAVVSETGGKILLFRRPEDSSLLAGLWELPLVEAGTSGETAVLEEALRDRYGGSWSVSEKVASVRHGITYRRMEVEIRRGAVELGDHERREGPDCRWVDPRELGSVPTSSLVGKILDAVEKAEGAM